LSIKFTTLGLLIYAAMLLWLLAGLACLPRGRRWQKQSSRLFAGGFLLLVSACALRWWQAGQPPLQSMFEVMLTLGMFIYPLWVFSEKFLQARFQATAVILGLAVLVPVGFVFQAQASELPPALRSWLFIPHVAAYMLAYAILILAGAQAAMQLICHRRGNSADAQLCELASSKLVGLAFPLLCLALALGAVWGQLAWADYWHWDPKELWSLATILIFAAYLHFRRHFGKKYMRINAIIVIVGCACVIVTLLWVNLSRLFQGMHNYAS
jgi:ABC-type transport system involved in cytochrome c biogenesis permease subunit